MLKALIIDDELHCIETLLWEIKENCPQLVMLESCNSSLKALELIPHLKPDLVFLDIEMPYLNGFEFLQKLEKIDFDIIFTTAYDMFAIKAFKFSATDYLLKPIDGEELAEAVKKVEEKKGIKNNEADNQEKLNFLLQNFIQNPNPIPPKKLAIPTMDGLEFLDVDTIVYCFSDSNYTHIVCTNRPKILVSKTLKDLESLLEDYRFFRVHISYLVSLNHVKKYVKGSGGYVIMSNDEQVNVARGRKDELLKLFNS